MTVPTQHAQRMYAPRGEGPGIAWVEHWGPRIAPAADVLPRALQCGDTPLHLAAYTGKTDTVEALLRHKANIEAKDDVSDTSQHALPEGSESRGVMRADCACER